MAGSLTDDELKSLTAYPEPSPEPAPVKRDPQKLRADAIVKDIYARHGIKPGVPLDKAMAYVMTNAQIHGLADDSLQSTSGWANPEERAAAREAYARSKPKEAFERWEKSAYLMDPQTARYQQDFVRDADFLEHLSKVPAGQPFEYHYGQNASGPQTAPKLGDALEYWDRSNMNPLWRDSWWQANYQSQSGVGNAAMNATSNPDVPTGAYLNASEVVPDFLRMQGSGETQTAGQSFQAAAGKRLALNRYRPMAPSMILDLPDGASQQDRRDRILALRGELQQATLPNPDQRWRQWTKQNFGAELAPPKVVSSGLDAAISAIDPSMFIPQIGLLDDMAKGAKAGVQATKATAAAGGKTATQGAKMTAAARGAGRAARNDQFVEQGINQGLLFATGGAEEGKARTAEEIAAANAARKNIFDRTSRDWAIENADREALLRLQRDGLIAK